MVRHGCRVGAAVTRRASHRSGRAQLRHPARLVTGSRARCYSAAFRGHADQALRPGRVPPRQFRDEAPPSLRRVPAHRFPALNGTTEHSDALTAVSTCFLVVRRPITLPCACLRLSPRPDAGQGPGAFGCGCSQTASIREGTAGPPKFPGNPRAPMPCSSTPAGPDTPGHYGVPARPPI